MMVAVLVGVAVVARVIIKGALGWVSRMLDLTVRTVTVVKALITV